MLKVFKRFSSSKLSDFKPLVVDIVKGLNLFGQDINESRNLRQSTEVELVYKMLHNEKGAKFDHVLSKLLNLYNKQNLFKPFYQLLLKIEFINERLPSVEVYNEVFHSLLLISRTMTIKDGTRRYHNSTAIAKFALKLIDECFQNGVVLNNRSFRYLDRIIAQTDMIQLQLQYETVLSMTSRVGIEFLITSGQYERCMEIFHREWLKSPNEKTLLNLHIYGLIPLALARLDYDQVIEFLQILNGTSLTLKPTVWNRILTEALNDGNFEVCQYCFKEFVENNCRQYSQSFLLKLCDVLARGGDTINLIKLLELMKLQFKMKIDSVVLSKMVESVCFKGGYKQGWNLLNKFSHVHLDKTDFDNLMHYYPDLVKKPAILEFVDTALASNFNKTLKDIIYYTIFKKIHNQANLTSICHLMDKLISSDLEEQIFINYKIIIHSISRANNAKIFTYKFYQLLRQRGVKLTSKEYYYLLQNSLFGQGADDYTLTKYFILEQLQTYSQLTPIQLQLLEKVSEDAQIQEFLKQYILHEMTGVTETDYPRLLRYDIKNIFQYDTPNHTINNYRYRHDLENSYILDHIRQ